MEPPFLDLDVLQSDGDKVVVVLGRSLHESNRASDEVEGYPQWSLHSVIYYSILTYLVF